MQRYERQANSNQSDMRDPRNKLKIRGSMPRWLQIHGQSRLGYRTDCVATQRRVRVQKEEAQRGQQRPACRQAAEWAKWSARAEGTTAGMSAQAQVQVQEQTQVWVQVQVWVLG